MSDRITGYKVFTHDLRPPVRGGDPVWDGVLPHALAPVTCDDGPDECAAGWNFSRFPQTALQIAGLWPNGRPSRIFVVTAEQFIERSDKCRSASLTIVREFAESEVQSAIEELSRPFGQFAAEMVREQMAWRAALARPQRDEAAVERGLDEALAARGLGWKLKRFDSVEAARAAWAAWAAWDAWDARDAWAARAAWAAWDARDARDAWAAWDARDACTVHFAARKGWTKDDPALLTVGLRDAYTAGLAIAVPTGPDELGWVMEPTS